MPVLFVPMLILGSSSLLEVPAADEDFRRNVFARYESGNWTGEAAYFGPDYGDGPEYRCRMAGPGAAYVQTRRTESGQMAAGWSLLPLITTGVVTGEVTSVELRGDRYRVARLPWRLVAPAGKDAIVLSFDRELLAVRRSDADEWLPFEYLTLNMLRADVLKVGYVREAEDGRKVPESAAIPLRGLAEVAKWCGRQLLRDRQDEERVRALTR